MNFEIRHSLFKLSTKFCRGCRTKRLISVWTKTSETCHSERSEAESRNLFIAIN